MEPPGTGTCMVLSGYIDSARTQIDRSFVTHYGVIGAMEVDHLDKNVLAAGSDHMHIAGYYNFKRLQGATGQDSTEKLLQLLRANGATTSLCAQYDASERWDGS